MNSNRIKRGGAALAALFLALMVCATPAFAWEETDHIIASGHGTFTPQYLVVHSTGNAGATAWNHVRYWQRIGNNAYMPQWVCDWTGDGTVYQVAPGNAVTWHVGNGNWYSVGLEICEGTTREQADKSIDTAAQWCAYYLKEQGWGIDRLISHNEARVKWGGTDHVDPDPYFQRWGYSWSWFKSKVASYMNGTTVSTPSQSTQSAPTASASGSVADLAARVMRGEFGSGSARRSALGNRYDEVQAYVNRVYFGIGSGTSAAAASHAPSTADLAARVMRGEFGSGSARRSALGNRYSEVQAYVNRVYYGIY